MNDSIINIIVKCIVAIKYVIATITSHLPHFFSLLKLIRRTKTHVIKPESTDFAKALTLETSSIHVK